MFANTWKQAVRAVVPDAVLSARYERWFFGLHEWRNVHCGRFATRDEARDFLASRGFDGHYEIDHAQWAAERSDKLHAHDYPVLFWLGKLLDRGDRLVDLGGSVGVSYYLFRRYLDLPRDLVWEVSELSEVAEQGRQLLLTNPTPNLRFTDQWQAMSGASILLAAGVLQFLDLSLEQMLADSPVPPRHLLVNRVALTTTATSFVTLQNTGRSIAPVSVETVVSFLAGLSRRGYELVDQWRCLENSTQVPFHPECDVPCFHGFYLRHRPAAVAH